MCAFFIPSEPVYATMSRDDLAMMLAQEPSYSSSITVFLIPLTGLVRERCLAQDENWQLFLSPRRFIL